MSNWLDLYTYQSSYEECGPATQPGWKGSSLPQQCYLFPHPLAYPMSHQCEHSRIFSLFHLHVTKHDDDDYDVMLANDGQRNIPISYHLEIMCTVNGWTLMMTNDYISYHVHTWISHEFQENLY